VDDRKEGYVGGGNFKVDHETLGEGIRCIRVRALREKIPKPALGGEKGGRGPPNQKLRVARRGLVRLGVRGTNVVYYEFSEGSSL